MSQRWPPGYSVERQAGRTLVAIDGQMDAVLAAGLSSSEGWERHLQQSNVRATAGRGSSAVVEIGGSAVRLKRLKRGGLVGPLWRERFLGTRRLRQNLEVPLEARRRGVATPRPVALLMLPGPSGMYRGWLACEEVVGAANLLEACTAPAGLDRGVLVQVLAEVRRMHDAGVEHRDLNLGNLLVGEWANAGQTWIVDLDRARLHAGPLGWRQRRRALERLERSWEKAIQRGGAGPGVSLAEIYSKGDPLLAARLARGRGLYRYRLALHRLAWRRAGREHRNS